eukprot:1160944-Pelagomonas_calceolata.AAC.11
MSCGTVWAEWGWLEGGASSFCRPLLPREDVSMRPNKAAPALGSRARACMRAWQCCPDRLLAWHVCNQQKEVVLLRGGQMKLKIVAYMRDRSQSAQLP